MKIAQTTMIAGLSFFLGGGIALSAELDDLDLTIRVVESNSMEEIHHELSLPNFGSDVVSEHAEKSDGGEKRQNIDVAVEEHAENHEALREEHEENREDAIEDSNDVSDEVDEVLEDGGHVANDQSQEEQMTIDAAEQESPTVDTENSLGGDDGSSMTLEIPDAVEISTTLETVDVFDVVDGGGVADAGDILDVVDTPEVVATPDAGDTLDVPDAVDVADPAEVVDTGDSNS
jgi:hypothetical protein